MSLKNLRFFVALFLVLLFYTLFVTGFVLVHQLDLLLSLVGNGFGICSLIAAAYFLYWGLKESYADRRRNKQENPGQVIVRLPSSLTPYDFRIGGNGRTFNQDFVGQRQAYWRRGRIPFNKNIIEGLGFLLPGIKFIEYYVDRSNNTFPPGFWYTPIGLIWAYVYLVPTLYLTILLAFAYIRMLRKRMSAPPDNQQAVPSDENSLQVQNASEASE